LEWMRSGEELRLHFNPHQDLDELVRLCGELGVARVHIHHLLGLAPVLWDLPSRLGLAFDFTAHDYYAICPQCNLTTPEGRYCGEPGSTACNACLAERPAPNGMDIGSWRDAFSAIFGRAARVILHSQDALTRLRRYFPNGNYLLFPGLPQPAVGGGGSRPSEYLARYLDGILLPLGGDGPATGQWLSESRCYRRPRNPAALWQSPGAVAERVARYLGLERPLTAGDLNDVLDRADRLGGIQSDLADKERQISTITAELALCGQRLSAQRHDLEQRLDEQCQALVQRDQLLQSLYQSTSWRATAPLRGLKLAGIKMKRLLTSVVRR
jgi:hypothetical protein